MSENDNANNTTEDRLFLGGIMFNLAVIGLLALVVWGWMEVVR